MVSNTSSVALATRKNNGSVTAPGKILTSIENKDSLEHLPGRVLSPHPARPQNQRSKVVANGHVKRMAQAHEGVGGETGTTEIEQQSDGENDAPIMGIPAIAVSSNHSYNYNKNNISSGKKTNSNTKYATAVAQSKSGASSSRNSRAFTSPNKVANQRAYASPNKVANQRASASPSRGANQRTFASPSWGASASPSRGANQRTSASPRRGANQRTSASPSKVADRRTFSSPVANRFVNKPKSSSSTVKSTSSSSQHTRNTQNSTKRSIKQIASRIRVVTASSSAPAVPIPSLLSNDDDSTINTAETRPESKWSSAFTPEENETRETELYQKIEEAFNMTLQNNPGILPGAPAVIDSIKNALFKVQHSKAEKERELRKQIDKVKAEKEELEAQLRKEMAGTAIRRAELAKELESAQKKQQRVEDSLKKQTAASEAIKRELTSKMSDASKEKEELTRHLAYLSKSRSELERALESEMSQVEKDRDSLQTVVGDRKKIQKQKAENKELETKIERMTEEASKEKLALQAEVAELQKFEEHISKLKEQNKETQQSLKNERGQLKKLADVMLAKKSALEETKSAMEEQYQKEIEELEGQIKSTKMVHEKDMEAVLKNRAVSYLKNSCGGEDADATDCIEAADCAGNVTSSAGVAEVETEVNSRVEKELESRRKKLDIHKKEAEFHKKKAEMQSRLEELENQKEIKKKHQRLSMPPLNGDESDTGDPDDASIVPVKKASKRSKSKKKKKQSVDKKKEAVDTTKDIDDKDAQMKKEIDSLREEIELVRARRDGPSEIDSNLRDEIKMSLARAAAPRIKPLTTHTTDFFRRGGRGEPLQANVDDDHLFRRGQALARHDVDGDLLFRQGREPARYDAMVNDDNNNIIRESRSRFMSPGRAKKLPPQHNSLVVEDTREEIQDLRDEMTILRDELMAAKQTAQPLATHDQTLLTPSTHHTTPPPSSYHATPPISYHRTLPPQREPEERGGGHRFASPPPSAGVGSRPSSTPYHEEDPNDIREAQLRGGGGYMSPGRHPQTQSSSHMNYEEDEYDIREERDDIRTDIRERQRQRENRRRSNPLPRTGRSSHRFMSPGGGGEREPRSCYSLEEESDRTNMAPIPPAPLTCGGRFTSPGGRGFGSIKNRQSFPLYDDENRENIGGGINGGRRRPITKYGDGREEDISGIRNAARGGGGGGGGNNISSRSQYQRYDDDREEDAGVNRTNYSRRRRGRSKGRAGMGGDRSMYGNIDDNEDYVAGRMHLATPPLTRAENLLQRSGLRTGGRSRY